MKPYHILMVLSALTVFALLPVFGSQPVPQKATEIRVYAICGKEAIVEKNCPVYLLNEREFGKWTRGELKGEDLKTRGVTPLKLTGLSEGRYYAGVSAMIAPPPDALARSARDSRPPEVFQWCEEFFLNDSYVASDGYIGVVSRTSVGIFLRKWYPVRATCGKPASVVSIYLPRELPLKDHLSLYPSTSTYKVRTTPELIRNMGAKLSEFWDVNEEDWSTMIQLVSRGGKAAAHCGRGDCVVSLDLEGNLLVSFPGVKIHKGKGTDSVPLRPAMLADPNISAEDLLPTFDSELKGSNEVRIVNSNDFVVTAGLRSNGRGKNMRIPANGRSSVFVPDGKYDIYFVYSSEPGTLFRGDSFELSRNGVEIHLVKVVGGNYNIRRVKPR